MRFLLDFLRVRVRVRSRVRVVLTFLGRGTGTVKSLPGSTQIEQVPQVRGQTADTAGQRSSDKLFSAIHVQVVDLPLLIWNSPE